MITYLRPNHSNRSWKLVLPPIECFVVVLGVKNVKWVHVVETVSLVWCPSFFTKKFYCSDRILSPVHFASNPTGMHSCHELKRRQSNPKFSISFYVRCSRKLSPLPHRNEPIKTRYSSVPATCPLCSAHGRECPSFTSLIHVAVSCRCFMLLLHVRASCLCFMSLLHVPATTCPYYM